MNFYLRLMCCVLLLYLPLVCCISSCASKQSAKDILPKEENPLLFEFDKEGFIDNNTFRVIVIIPAGEQYDELSVQQKGQERAFVLLKNYIISRNKSFDSKMHNYIMTTISTYGTLKKRDSTCTTRYCYYFDITKSGLKAEIDTLGQ